MASVELVEGQSAPVGVSGFGEWPVETLARPHGGAQQKHGGKATKADSTDATDYAITKHESFRTRITRLVTVPWRRRPLLGMDRDTADRVDEALALVGLQALADRYPHELSGGEAQRVALARAFVSRPDILLADEPTGSLDQATGHRVLDLLFELKERNGATLIMVTHSSELATRCSRLVRLVDGLIVGDDAGDLLDG